MAVYTNKGKRRPRFVHSNVPYRARVKDLGDPNAWQECETQEEREARRANRYTAHNLHALHENYRHSMTRLVDPASRVGCVRWKKEG